MSETVTVRELAALHPEIRDFDYKWADSPNHRDLPGVLADYGYRLADGDEDVAGDYNDIKGYYGCRVVTLDSGL